jgi:hypothetical protein
MVYCPSAEKLRASEGTATLDGFTSFLEKIALAVTRALYDGSF